MTTSQATSAPPRRSQDGSDYHAALSTPTDTSGGDPPSGDCDTPFRSSSLDVVAGRPAADPAAKLHISLPRAERKSVGPVGGWFAARLEDAPDADLAAIASRCRLKAESLRWAVERRRLMADGHAFRSMVAPRDRELVERAKALGCYLWMNRPESPVPNAPTLFGEVAGWFETLADAASLVCGLLDDAEDHGDVPVETLNILAEAQSALRLAIGWIGGPEDPDRVEVLAWLRTVARRRGVYLPHLGADLLESPPRRPEVVARLDDLASEFRHARADAKRRRSRLNRLRYHAGLIEEGTGGEHDWRKVAEAVDEFVGDGTPPSSPEFRGLLLPIRGRLPELDGLPKGFRLALREIDRFLAGRPSVPATIHESRRTAEVAEAARLLRGRGVVLIGGKRRPEAQRSLQVAFRLEQMIWIETREHQSIQGFEAIIARPEVALVLLAIRWSSHSFGDVKRFCEEYGKPFVRLPGGYNPNQVAAQILSQCSEQLAPDRLGLAIPDTLCRVA